MVGFGMNVLSSAYMDAIQQDLGVSFDDKALLELAFMHSSFIAESSGEYVESNERLEFLGDALIGLAIAQDLYHRLPRFPEGQLSQMRTILVSNEALAQIADNLNLGGHLIFGKGEMETGGVERESNQANVFEALIGAMFLDKGYEFAREFTLKVMNTAIVRVIDGDTPLKHPKSLLHEEAMDRGYGPPTYKVIKESGVDHQPEFTVQALVDGKVIGMGIGSRKSLAEREAAREALQMLRKTE